MLVEAPLESLPQKALRHTIGGEFDPDTLFRGLKQTFDAFRTLGNYDYSFRDLGYQTFPDYLGVSGLQMTQYLLEPVGATQLPSFLRQLVTIHPRVYEFPGDSHIEVHTTTPTNLVSTENYIYRVPDAIASFTGPTFQAKAIGLPNNGFYSSDCPQQVPFETENNLPGRRHGAFGVTEEWDLTVFNDEQKWEAVKDNFAGYRSVVGTSHYLTDQDRNLPAMPSRKKSLTELSYLMQYLADGQARNCFIIAAGPISRVSMRDVLDDYTSNRGASSYLAVELEYYGSAILVKGEGNVERFGGDGFDYRQDHYVVVRDNLR